MSMNKSSARLSIRTGSDPQNNTMRLQKFLAHAGVCSRRAAEELIRQGRVRVDGATVREMGIRVEPGKHLVEVDGRLIAGCEKHIYLVLNKPRGVLCTLKDTHGRKTVIDLVGDTGARIYPVGRLDMDSEGLLLLTNDGALAQRLLHPSHHVSKKYLVTVKGRPSKKDLALLENGIEINGRLTQPCSMKLAGTRKHSSIIEVTLYQGMKRQIRLMMESISHPVTRLKRIEMGPIKLGGLAPGSFRELDSEEVSALRRAAGMTRFQGGTSEKMLGEIE